MKSDKEQIDLRVKQLVRFILRYKSKWMAAGLMLVLGAGSVAGAYSYTPKDMQPSDAVNALPETESIDWEPETTSRIVESSEAEEAEWKPSPRELNLAHYFPEGADQNDITKSLAGEAFKILMTHDEEWISSIYDFSDVAPAQMASRLGRSGKSVMGRYNPKDDRHDKMNPDTWTINSFKNIRMTAVDGDGNSITPYSNVLEIMSMANFYTYYKGVDDYDLFLSYAKELWELSHSYTVSMSDVYYCSGCMSEDAERKEMEALEAEAKAEALGLAAESAESEEADALADGQQESSAETPTTSTVIQAGKAAAEKAREAASAAQETSAEKEVFSAAESGMETVPESTSAVIIAGASASGTSTTGTSMESTSAENSAGMSSESSAGTSAEAALASGEETAAGTQAVVLDEENASSAEGASEASPSDALTSKASGAKEELTDCPGHVDLIIHMKITGLDEKNNLFELDTTGNDSAGFEENGWKGWDQYAKACARILSNQDWFEKYGLTVSSISARNPLTTAEIDAYMAQLPPDLSETRRDIIRFALESVGKVPYYWGGKPSAPNYASNSFGVLTTADYKGRVYKGLDCSGWINWVYWSVTGRRLPYESTSGLAATGTRIQRSELQPGDIIVRTGADAHVIMFLGWTLDGRIQCIHESSASVNNVTVAVRDANWQYYRKLVD